MAVAARLGWEPPGTAEALADRWVSELDRHGVSRSALIASIPGDEGSVATAVARHPSRFVGFVMFNPLAPDAQARLARALDEQRFRVVALFPAMHRYHLEDDQVSEVLETVRTRGAAVFVHCGVLSVGVRKKLGLPSRFDLRLGDPLGVAAVAVRHPEVTVVIPHFGAGFFREALIAADAAPNIVLDTSSSNSWIRLEHHLTLPDVFARALDCVGPSRLLFGTDSSFFPRGWQRPVYEAQREALTKLGAPQAAQDQIFGGNFVRLLCAPETLSS